MTRLLQANPSGIREASRALLEGGLVAYPTDTVYGLGCDPFDQGAVVRLIKAKRRVRGALPLLVDTFEKANELGKLSGTAVSLAKRFWPGPMTLVIPARVALPPQVTGPGDTVGLRIPNRVETVDLITQCRGAIVGTSANLSGNPSPKTVEDVLRDLEGQIDLLLDGGPSGLTSESSVVKVEDGKLTILRARAVPRNEIYRALEPEAV